MLPGGPAPSDPLAALRAQAEQPASVGHLLRAMEAMQLSLLQGVAAAVSSAVVPLQQAVDRQREDQDRLREGVPVLKKKCKFILEIVKNLRSELQPWFVEYS